MSMAKHNNNLESDKGVAGCSLFISCAFLFVIMRSVEAGEASLPLYRMASLHHIKFNGIVIPWLPFPESSPYAVYHIAKKL